MTESKIFFNEEIGVLRKSYKSEQLPIIYPMVLYHGDKPYNYSTDIMDLFVERHDLAQEIMFKPFNLIDLNQIADDELLYHQWSGVMTVIMKRARARDFLTRLAALMPILREFDEVMPDNKFITKTMHYIINVMDKKQFNDFVGIVSNELPPKRGEEAMTAAEMLIERGKDEGQIRTKNNIARKLLNEGTDPQFIAKITDLSLAEIQELSNKAEIV